jgi:hypothetical protein
MAGATDSGWFAYAPLNAGSPLFDGHVFLSRQHVVGLVILVLGLVTVAAAAGYWVGFRRATNRGTSVEAMTPSIVDDGPDVGPAHGE